ncbi:cytochrome P450 [Saccharothrix australiensis]|uniref:Cytochrome P450 n=1 Tax=Saccharothrix australiensis TaxID=2072 RepID=A0A495VWT7_9PSEU|nr:cytochrome P450 [Saccharothrix australiensis]RKT53842.1 unspecific monooxygenase/hypothetical protein [Saccharothrix australiensis]
MLVLPSLADPAALRDWHGTFRAFREHDRVHWDEGAGTWLVTHYHDVVAALHNDLLDSCGPTSFMGLFPPAEQEEFRDLQAFYESWMVFSGPPYHQRVRSAVQGVLTPRAVARRRAEVRATARAQLDLARDGVVDFFADFARPLAISVISEVLGIPSDEWDVFSRWSHDLIAFIGAPRPEVEKARIARRAYAEMREYVLDFTAALRRAGRTDNPLLAVEPIGEHAVVGTFAQFLTGGCDPISSGIANTVVTMLRHPDQTARLRADRSLLPTAVEEFLRYEAPFTLAPRVAREPVTVADRELPAGSRVMLMFTAANRDPAVFRDPDRVDVGRSPNPHLAFGKGNHYCIGAGLARLEMAETIDTLLTEAPDLALAGDVEWTASLGLRSVAKLPVTVGR